MLLVLRGLTGVGEAALFVGAATLIADLSPGHRRAEAASYFSVALYAGLGIGPIIGESVIDRTSFEVAFLTAAAFAALAAAMSLSLPKWVATASGDDDDVAAAAPGAEPAPTGLTSRRSAAFVHPVALGPGLVLACGSAAFAVFSAFLPEYSRQLGLSGSGALFAVYSVVCLGVRLVGARLPERLGPRTSGTTTFCVLGAALLLLAAVPQRVGAVGGGGARRRGDGVPVPVAHGADRQPGAARRTGAGDQLVHDVLRDRHRRRRARRSAPSPTCSASASGSPGRSCCAPSGCG